MPTGRLGGHTAYVGAESREVAVAEEVTLRDGTPAMIWALAPDDARGLRENYRRLSAQSQFNRFLTASHELPDSLLHLLVDEVDGVEHIARVLVAFPADASERPVGVGRLVRIPERPTAADVAVTVLDDWQGRGVATVLLSELVAHRPPGVTELLTQVGVDNAASFAMLARLGPLQVASGGPGVREVHVQLPPSPADPAEDVPPA